MILDASVWVSRFLSGDVHHDSAAACITHLLQQKHRLLVPVLAWAEIAGAIARRTGSAQAGNEAVRLLQNQPWLDNIALDAPLAREAAALASAQKLRGADAVYVALAAARRMPLITLDTEILERASDAVDCMTPADWLQRG